MHFQMRTPAMARHLSLKWLSIQTAISLVIEGFCATCIVLSACPTEVLYAGVFGAVMLEKSSRAYKRAVH